MYNQLEIFQEPIEWKGKWVIKASNRDGTLIETLFFDCQIEAESFYILNEYKV